jgi:hypothetical protein
MTFGVVVVDGLFSTPPELMKAGSARRIRYSFLLTPLMRSAKALSVAWRPMLFSAYDAHNFKRRKIQRVKTNK